MLRKLGRVTTIRQRLEDVGRPAGAVRDREVPDTHVRLDAADRHRHLAVPGVRAGGGGSHAGLATVQRASQNRAGRGVHCVTQWSKLQNTWEGVAFTGGDEAGGSQPRGEVRYDALLRGLLEQPAAGGAADDDVLFAYKHDGEEITAQHGCRFGWWCRSGTAGRARVGERRGVHGRERARLLEMRGYHMEGDPWKKSGSGAACTESGTARRVRLIVVKRNGAPLLRRPVRRIWGFSFRITPPSPSGSPRGRSRRAWSTVPDLDQVDHGPHCRHFMYSPLHVPVAVYVALHLGHALKYNISIPPIQATALFGLPCPCLRDGRGEAAAV